jgi:hypothetical protein
MGIEVAGVRGVAVQYGPRNTLGKYGRKGVEDGVVKSAEWVFDYNDLPEPSEGGLEFVLPAYAKIVSAKFETLVAFAGGTSLNAGLQKSDGTEIDDDGLFTTTNLAVANVNARGKTVAGSGALVGGSVGADAGELVVEATGTFTAGKGRIIVQYVVEKFGN